MKTILIFWTFILQASLVLAQTAPQIRSGRPGQSIGPFVVGTGYLQFQSGVDSSWLQLPLKESSYLLNNVIRLGLSEDFEVSSVINLKEDSFIGSKQSGVSSFQLGFRYNLISQSDGLIPALGFQTRFKTSFTSSEYRAENLAPIMILVSGHKLSDRAGLTINLGVNYDGATPVATYFYTTNVAYSLCDQWGTFVELYGNEKSGLKKNYIDTGLSYLANNNLQWDVSTGWGRNQSIEEYFVSFGISYRMKIFNAL